MKLKKYTESQLRKAVENNFSLAKVLRCLGVSPAGGNYETLKKAIEYFEIGTEHFTGQGHLKGKTHTYNTRFLNEILVYGKIENTHRLRCRLIKEGIKSHQCESCKLTKWLGESIPLELHHVDGDRKNNTLENLELLCSNCHALTPNFRGRGKAVKRQNAKV